MYFKTLFIFLALTFFSACGASASPAKDSASMSWLNSPPSDNAQYFYGVGYGKTQKEAKSDALATISAKISVSVASSFSSSVTATRQDGNEDILESSKSDVVSKSKKIEYTDVKVEESHNDGKKWIVLVEVDRSVLTNTYVRKLKKVDAKLQAEWEIFQDAGLFEKLKITPTIEKYLSETDTYFPIIHALNPNFDARTYNSRYINYTTEMKKSAKQLIFKIKNDKNSEALAELVRSELSGVNAKFNNSNYNILINITTKVKTRKVKSTNADFKNLIIALRLTKIKATDKNGNVVSNAVYKTKEGSTSGLDDAIQKVSKYQKKIDKKGIISFLTGN